MTEAGPQPPSEFPRLITDSDFQDTVTTVTPFRSGGPPTARQASARRVSFGGDPAGPSRAAGDAAKSARSMKSSRGERSARAGQDLSATSHSPPQAPQHASFADVLRQNAKLTQQLASARTELERAQDLVRYQRTGYERHIQELEKEVQRLSRLVPSLDSKSALYPEFAEIASIQRSIRTRLEALKYEKRVEAERASAEVRGAFVTKIAELESNIFALKEDNDQLREEKEGGAAQRAMAKEVMFLRTECKRLSAALEAREAAIFSYRCNRESDTAELQRLRTELAITQRNHSDLRRKTEMLELLLANARGEGNLAERTRELLQGLDLGTARRSRSAGSAGAAMSGPGGSSGHAQDDIPDWQKEVERRRRSGGRQIQSVGDYTDEFIAAPPQGKQRPATQGAPAAAQSSPTQPSATTPAPRSESGSKASGLEGRRMRDRSLEKSLRARITALEDENRRLKLSLQLATSNLRSAQLDRQRLLDAPTPIRDILMNCLHDVSYEIGELRQNRIPVGYERRNTASDGPGSRYNYSGLSPQDRDMFLLRLMQYQDVFRSASQALLAEESMLLYGGAGLQSFSEAVRAAQARSRAGGSSPQGYGYTTGRGPGVPGGPGAPGGPGGTQGPQSQQGPPPQAPQRVRIGTPQEYKLPRSAGSAPTGDAPVGAYGLTAGAYR